MNKKKEFDLRTQRIKLISKAITKKKYAAFKAGSYWYVWSPFTGINYMATDYIIAQQEAIKRDEEKLEIPFTSFKIHPDILVEFRQLN